MHNNISASELSGLALQLCQDGLLDPADAKLAMHAAKNAGMPLSYYLVKKQILSGEQIVSCCQKKFALATLQLDACDYTFISDSIITIELIHKYKIIPLNNKQDAFMLGITDPFDHDSISAIEFHTGQAAKLVLVDVHTMEKILHTHYRYNILYSHLESTLSSINTVEEVATNQEHGSDENDEPIIKFVDQLIDDAISKHVSDIHIEPYETNCRIRFRRDGLLYEAASVPKQLANRITMRLKIMAKMNIAERRLPQDGRLSWRDDLKIDIRMNSCPTLFGEKIVLRILSSDKLNLSLHELGMNAAQLALFRRKLEQPQGLILVTGPTGSGKTITLYSALHYLNHEQINIASVEDPVEIYLPGINQVSINPKIGLDFVVILRTLLRQDPDIIMLGEIRDSETATIAMQAAQTGHLVLSTLHTNNVIETIYRLNAMNIPAHHLINSLSLIVAQRLVRKLCDDCKQNLSLTNHKSTDTTHTSLSCDKCHHGYRGRTGIFELLPITDTIKQMIMSGRNSHELSNQMHQEKALFLHAAGLEKVHAGITSMAELTRVLGT